MARSNNSSCLTVGNSNAVQEDSSSLYFLQNGDHPGLILVSHPFMGPNTWNHAMRVALTAKNKISFIDGSILQPTENDLLFNSWTRCNSMVISWILNSAVKEIADSLFYIESAAEIWNDLHNRFHQSNGPRIFQIKKQFLGLNQGSLDVTMYYTRLKTLWDELKEYQVFT